MNAQPPTSITRTPEDIVQRSDLEIPQLLLPEPSRLFAERALRLRQLAASHAMRDYLMLLALVGEAQHARVQSQTAMVLPTLAQLDSAAQEGSLHWAPPAGHAMDSGAPSCAPCYSKCWSSCPTTARHALRCRP